MLARVGRRAMRTGLASAIAASALASCGGSDGGDDISGDEEALRASVTAAATSKDPDSCARYSTQRFLEEITGKRGRAALRSCRADADEAGIESVAFGRVAISDRRASATVRPQGDKEDGLRTLELKLRKADGRWKVDRLARGTVERGAIDRLLREELSAPPNELDAASIGCVVRKVRAIAETTLARAIIGGNPLPVSRAIHKCLLASPAERAGTA